jgi:hypothetical protein
MIFGKKNYFTYSYVLISSKIFVRNISHYKKHSVRHHKCTYVFIKVHFSCHILIQFKSSRQIFEKYTNIKFHENPSTGSRVVACGRTDMTNLIAAFNSFAKAPKSLFLCVIFFLPNFECRRYVIHINFVPSVAYITAVGLQWRCSDVYVTRFSIFISAFFIYYSDTTAERKTYFLPVRLTVIPEYMANVSHSEALRCWHPEVKQWSDYMDFRYKRREMYQVEVQDFPHKTFIEHINVRTKDDTLSIVNLSVKQKSNFVSGTSRCDKIHRYKSHQSKLFLYHPVWNY